MRSQIPTNAQIVRAERTAVFLHSMGIKRYAEGLFAEDPERLRLREAAEVASRAAVLWIVSCAASGYPREAARETIERLGLTTSTSPLERAFLREEPTRSRDLELFRWKGESLFACLWALGRVERLGPPDRTQSLTELGTIVGSMAERVEILLEPKLRPDREILDAQDLFLRFYRFGRDELSRGRSLPRKLIFEVIRERHLTINWLVRSGDQDWDEVTPT